MAPSDFLIERYYAAYEFSTKYMLSSSDAESYTVDEILRLDDNYHDNLDQFLELHLGYTESQGNPQLRQEITNLYSTCEADQILVFSGAEEGIYSFMLSQLRRGDHIIVMFPTYQSLYQVAQNNGVAVSLWELEERNNWMPSIEQLEGLITSNTVAIVINTPHNPTGFHFSKHQLEAIVAICEDHDLVLFGDEVYRFGEYDLSRMIPPVTDMYEKGVSLGVLSKPLGLPGLRIGWIATKNHHILDRLIRFKDYTTICNSAPSEFLATLALQNRQTILDRNAKIIQHNLKLLEEFMSRFDQYFSWIRPQAGNIAFVRLLLNQDVVEFCDRLRTDKNVLLLPSTTYQYGSRHFRIGFGRKNFPEALSHLEDFMREHYD